MYALQVKTVHGKDPTPWLLKAAGDGKLDAVKRELASPDGPVPPDTRDNGACAQAACAPYALCAPCSPPAPREGLRPA